MTLAPEQTFDYVAGVPAGHAPGTTSVVWAYRARDRAGETVPRLVGPRPALEVWDGLVVLTALGREGAAVHAAMFRIDPELVRLFESGDELSLAYTAAGGLGLSLLRGGELVFAAGQVTAVPLGKAVVVRNVARGSPRLRPWQEMVVEVTAPGEGQELRAGHYVRIGGYDVSVERCRDDGEPAR